AELVALEDVVLRPRLSRGTQVRVDRAAYGPDAAFLALDPDHDRLGVAVRVDAVEHALREPTAVGGRLHSRTMPPRGRGPPRGRARPGRRRRPGPARPGRWP